MKVNVVKNILEQWAHDGGSEMACGRVGHFTTIPAHFVGPAHTRYPVSHPSYSILVFLQPPRFNPTLLSLDGVSLQMKQTCCTTFHQIRGIKVLSYFNEQQSIGMHLQIVGHLQS